jgi:hypothetical protein
MVGTRSPESQIVRLVVWDPKLVLHESRLKARMMSLVKRHGMVDGVLLVANAVGALIYVLRARQAWVIPEEAANGIHTITGEPFVWAVAVLPVWIVFLVINLTWAVTILARRRWLQFRTWLMSPFIWIIAVTIDFAHH